MATPVFARQGLTSPLVRLSNDGGQVYSRSSSVRAGTVAHRGDSRRIGRALGRFCATFPDWLVLLLTVTGGEGKIEGSAPRHLLSRGGGFRPPILHNKCRNQPRMQRLKAGRGRRGVLPV